jgi:shikimate kinase
MNLTLIGMPASGKSTVGRVLAVRLGFGLTDADQVLEQRYQQPIQQVLERLGDERLVSEEGRAVIEAVSGKTDLIVTPGGSIIYNQEAMRFLQAASVIIYLQASLVVLERRIADQPRGIVGSGSKTLAQIYAERAPLYAHYANMTVDADRPVTQVATLIQARLGL